MKKTCLVLALLCLAVSGCTTGGRKYGVWSGEIDRKFETIRYYYSPQPLSSAEEAIGAIKNLQANLAIGPCCDVTSLDVDTYGLRMAAVDFVASSAWVPDYGAIAGDTHPPVYGDAYQEKSGQNNILCVIPFKEVTGLQLARPKAPRGHWGTSSKPYRVRLIVTLVDKPAAGFVAADEKTAQQFADALATLVIAQGRDPFRTMIGAQLQDMTAAQKADSGIAGGALVRDVYAGSPAEMTGIQFLDIIVKVGRTPVSSVAQFQREMERSGDFAALEIRRLEKRANEKGAMAYVYSPYDIRIPLKPRN
jgi:hypothetical protein